MSGKSKQPISHGVAKVPVVMQLEALECGAACLTMVLAYYDKWIPLEQIRTECGVSRDGSNAGNMMKAARLHGLKASAYRMEPEALAESGRFPCIVHWEFNHFVVVNGIKGNKVYLNDPARGSCTVSRERFDEGFTGICILLEPGEDFEPSGKPKSMMSFVKKRLKGTGPAMAFTAVTGIIAALMGIINPAFSRVFIDELLSGKNPGWLMPFLLLLAGFSLLQIAASALQSIYSLRISGKMAAVGNAEYMWKVLRLPMAFFSQRMAGDIQGRQSSNAQIANTLINTLAPLLLNAVMLLFYLVVMTRYSLLLTLVGVLSLAVNTAISTLVSKKRVNIMRVSMRESAKLSAATVAGIEMIETIKAGGAENGYFAKWSGYQAAVNTENVKAVRLNQLLGIVPQLVNTLANSAVLILGVWLAMSGEMTVGMIMAFQGFLSAFMAPAMTMISAGQTVQEMRTQMERIDDVMEYPEERIFAEDDNEPEHRKLSGCIEIKNISFGYSPLAKPLIENFDLSVKPGQSVAIVGSSGCGKSTVSKLISGLYKPWSGEILFDGKKMSEISSAVFRSSLAVVDQDIILFEDTIENNIKMWDSSIEDFEMILAARDAQIHYDIMQRPDGYRGRLTEGGRDLSGGQRQRLEIARVLAQDPTIIILDEATSALDAKTEYDVVRSVRDRGITCIVIAHRLSTIRSCDEIIVMDNGRIIDRGTHAELLEKCSVYRELVASE